MHSAILYLFYQHSWCNNIMPILSENIDFEIWVMIYNNEKLYTSPMETIIYNFVSGVEKHWSALKRFKDGSTLSICCITIIIYKYYTSWMPYHLTSVFTLSRSYNSSLVSALEYEASDLRSIHSSGELIGCIKYLHSAFLWSNSIKKLYLLIWDFQCRWFRHTPDSIFVIFVSVLIISTNLTIDIKD